MWFIICPVCGLLFVLFIICVSFMLALCAFSIDGNQLRKLDRLILYESRVRLERVFTHAGWKPQL